MKTTAPLYICTQCKEKFPFGSICYSRDGKRIVCKTCYIRTTNEKKVEFILERNMAPDYTRFICMECRYKFSFRKKPGANVRCPYCGNGKLIVDNITAEKLISEVSRSNDLYYK